MRLTALPPAPPPRPPPPPPPPPPLPAAPQATIEQPSARRARAAAVASGALVGALVVLALLTRAGTIAGLALTAALFVPLEHLVPLHRRPSRRAGWRTDVVHFLVDRMLTTVGVVAIVVAVGVAARVAVPQALRDAIASWPAGVQFALGFSIAEVGAYWGHRAAHQVPFLWRFHRVHHSSPQLDWLASARLHPLDQAFIRGCAIVPLFALGFRANVSAAVLVIFTVQALFVHANVRLTLGPLRWVVATPQYHHWHHARDEAHRGVNFGGELPLLDLLFGTLYLPARAWPAAYGIDEAMPDGYLAQLASPFGCARV